MTAFIIILTTLLIIFILYPLSVKGRSQYCDFKKFKGIYYAHRGLHSEGVPENSLKAFKLAVNKGYGAEFDVHILADGSLAVIHDHSLLRTAGVDVKIEELTLKDLENYCLEGTDEKIPTFKEVLNIFEGKRPIIIELKATNKDVDRLCSTVAKQLEGYSGDYCIESFDPRCVYWFKKHCNDTVRGQLSENYFENKKSTLPAPLKLVMSCLMTNFLTKPDFVAYRFKDRQHIANRISRSLWKIQSVGWTITEMGEIASADEENVISIFEGIEP